jgi:hypothetical protein
VLFLIPILLEAGSLAFSAYRVYRAARAIQAGVRVASAVGKANKVVKTAKKIEKAVKAAKKLKPKKPKQVCKPCAEAAKKKQTNREKYVGRTPGKNSKAGKAVQEQMKKDGLIRNHKGQQFFKDTEGNWRPMSQGDMAHKRNAVDYWNKSGRHHGAKAPQVRKWMNDPKNYRIDYNKINRSEGGKIKTRYKPPSKRR